MLVDTMTDAAEIAFAFFADIGDEEQGQGGDDAELMEGRGQRPERGESGAVVADAGTEEARLLAADVERSGGGKDGVEVGAEGDGRERAMALRTAELQRLKRIAGRDGRPGGFRRSRW